MSGLLFILVCTGCGPLRVNQMRQHAARGDDAWIAAQTVDCDRPSRTCGQLHLIKGAACLRLVESDRDPAGYFSCAVAELGAGLALTPYWEEAAERVEMLEKYCEALSGLQRLQSGKAARETGQRLLDAARTLYRLSPDSVPAVYFISLTGLRQLEPRLAGVSAADRLPVCSRLKRTVNRVLSFMDTAKSQDLPEWHRFAQRYQRLAFELGSAMHTARCR